MQQCYLDSTRPVALLTIHKYVDAKSKETLDVYNPSDDSLVVAGVHVAGSADIDAAVAAAAAAFKTGPWRTFSGQERAACMLKMADLIEANMERLGRLETLAMGVPVVLSKMLLGMILPIWRCKLPVSSSEEHVLTLQTTLVIATKSVERLFLPKAMDCTRSCDTSHTACVLVLELGTARHMLLA